MEQGEKYLLKAEESLSAAAWIRIKAVLKEYDNLKEGADCFADIEYEWRFLSEDVQIDLSQYNPGTYYFALLNDTISIASNPLPLSLQHPQLVQVVIREKDTYLGYLSECLGLPFIIPPKYIGAWGHQADLRIGLDCAALAIYGRRRMGYSIPYCGPKRIYQYLRSSDQLSPGTILHFGFQVSILYKDYPPLGRLNPEDLLIHAYQDKVAIQAIGNTKLWGMTYQMYDWK